MEAIGRTARPQQFTGKKLIAIFKDEDEGKKIVC
jgi:hypothetical protein